MPEIIDIWYSDKLITKNPTITKQDASFQVTNFQYLTMQKLHYNFAISVA